MGIQSNFNNSLMGMATIASLNSINNSIRDLGFSDYQELVSAINSLRIEIADCEDKGIPCDKKRKLLNEYMQVKLMYDAKIAKQKKDDEMTRKVMLWIFALSAVTLFITFIWLFSTI